MDAVLRSVLARCLFSRSCSFVCVDEGSCFIGEWLRGASPICQKCNLLFAFLMLCCSCSDSFRFFPWFAAVGELISILFFLESLSSFRVCQRPIPLCEDHQVLIKVKACALSELDIRVRRGVFGKFSLPLPSVLGFEISGVVHEKGADVTNVAVGDEVVGE